MEMSIIDQRFPMDWIAEQIVHIEDGRDFNTVQAELHLVNTEGIDNMNIA